MRFLSTYAKIFLMWSKISNKFLSDYDTKGSTRQTSNSPFSILSDDQISQAFDDPHNHSFKTFISKPYANSLEASRGMIQGMESVRNQKFTIEEALKMLDEQRRTADAESKAKIDTLVTTLTGQYKHLSNIEKVYSYNQNALQALNPDFERLATEHQDNWNNYREKYLTAINDTLSKGSLKDELPKERENLLRKDTWQEVLGRFTTDRGVISALSASKTEKLLKLNKPSYETYFKLKAFLAIYAISSSYENMGTHLAQLNDIFKAAAEEGQKITQSEEAQAKTLDESSIKPIVDIVTSNNKILENFEHERTKLLENIVTTKVIENIQEKVQARIADTTPEPNAAPAA